MPRIAYISMGCARARAVNLGEFQEAGETWNLITSVSAEEFRAPAGRPRALPGGLSMSPEYHGCSTCGNRGFFECNRCRNINCWSEGPSECYWCGTGLPPTPGFIEARSLD